MLNEIIIINPSQCFTHLTHLILTEALRGRDNYYTHFTLGETEALTGALSDRLKVMT